MEKEEFTKRLGAVNTSKATCCRDLGIAPTTFMRWKVVPGYAEAYLVGLEVMNEAGRMTWRHHLAVERLPADQKK